MTKVVLMLPDEPRKVYLEVSLAKPDGEHTKSYFDGFTIVPGNQVKIYINENV